MRAVRHRNFAIFLAGETVNYIGDAMATIALPLVMVSVLHAGTFVIGLLTSVMFVPWILVSLPAGVIVDRLPQRRLMIIVDISSAILYGTLAVAHWLHVLSPGLLLAIAFLTGTGNVIFTTACQTLIPSLVDADELVTANSWLIGSTSSAELTGPGLSGLIAGTVGVMFAIMANSLTFLVSALCLALIRTRLPATATSATSARTGVWRDMLGALTFVRNDYFLRQMTLWAAAVNLGLAGYDSLIIVYLVRVVHVGAGIVGLLFSLAATGAVVGSLTAGRVIRRLGNAHTMTYLALFGMPFIVIVPLTGRGAGLFFFIAGRAVSLAAIVVANIVVAAFRQSYVPAQRLGSITAATRFVAMGAFTAGGVIGGSLGTLLGIRDALWITTGVVTLAGLFLLGKTFRAHRDLPTGNGWRSATERQVTRLPTDGSRHRGPRPAGPAGHATLATSSHSGHIPHPARPRGRRDHGRCGTEEQRVCSVWHRY